MLRLAKMYAAVSLLSLGLLIGIARPTQAVSASDWKAGNIIDDTVFYDANAMTVGAIQAFLESKVPVCDTNGSKPSGSGGTRAEYGTARGYPPPYVCTKDYYENPSTRRNNLDGSSVPGGLSAAQIIKQASDEHGISPKTLLVLLQKEQTLITDDWPFSNQYRSATGFGCPDTAPCDAQYYGFYNQVNNAARQFRRYTTYPSEYRYKPYQTNYIQYNPNAGCGGTNVYVENRATAALYNYTPYQPNASSLNNMYGAGDGCGAYGNRNFWRMFSDWFGSTRNNSAFAWNYEGHTAYANSARTQQFTTGATVAPGGKIYMRLKARNTGNETWTNSVVKVGTTKPNDRISSFQDSSWPSANRAVTLSESSVTPGQVGTFDFVLKAPNTPGNYNEYFNLVAEGRMWFNDPGLFFTVNVVNEVTPSNSSRTGLGSGASLLPGQYLLSPDRNSTLNLQNDGNLVLYSNFRPLWNSGTAGKAVARLTMQGDGNLVLYSTTNQALWSSDTASNGANFALQTDSNLVVYSTTNQALWSSDTVHVPNNLGFVNSQISGSKLYPGQELSTANRRYKLLLQTDGNLVLYSPNRALWASGTDGRNISYLVMQGDGNAVLYDTSNRPMWNSGTSRSANARMVLQSDGNLVIYTPAGSAAWNTETANQQ